MFSLKRTIRVSVWLLIGLFSTAAVWAELKDPLAPPDAPKVTGTEDEPTEHVLPEVRAIISGHDNQIAVVDTRPVSPGDTVGVFVVERISEQAVYFRDPDNKQHRVELKRNQPEQQQNGQVRF